MDQSFELFCVVLEAKLLAQHRKRVEQRQRRLRVQRQRLQMPRNFVVEQTPGHEPGSPIEALLFLTGDHLRKKKGWLSRFMITTEKMDTGGSSGGALNPITNGSEIESQRKRGSYFFSFAGNCLRANDQRSDSELRIAKGSSVVFEYPWYWP